MPLITAHVFIDWDSARRLGRRRAKPQQQECIRALSAEIESCFSTLQNSIIDFLSEHLPSRAIKIVSNRVYHGWHRGRTETADRRAWDDAARKLRAQIRNKISYLPDVAYGSALVCGGSRSLLYDTLRARKNSGDEQKMVDTALVADLLSFCRTASGSFRRGEYPQYIAIIVADDDDLLPGAIVAEQWGLPTFVLRVTRSDECQHLNVNGMAFKLTHER